MFANKLQEAITSVSGSQATIIMGFDGIPLDSYGVGEETDIETVGMEMSVVLKEVKKAANLLETSPAEELTIRTDKKSMVLRVVNEEYFIVMMLSADGNLGKARYVLRMLAPGLREDLS